MGRGLKSDEGLNYGDNVYRAFVCGEMCHTLVFMCAPDHTTILNVAAFLVVESRASLLDSNFSSTGRSGSRGVGALNMR